VAILVAHAACSGAPRSPTASLRQGEAPPAVLAFYGDTSSVELPPSVRVGDSVLVRFSTFGGSCTNPGAIEVVISGLSAEIRPYLVEPPAELPDTVVCTAELRVDWREAQLRFERLGRAEVRIVGFAEPENRQVVLVREVEVTR
jgi:hypothetical protein